MKIARTVLLTLLALTLGVMIAAAAEHTWVGQISDSTCGANHLKGAEHGSRTMSNHDCVLACIKNGAQFVFVRKGKVYNIANQDQSDLSADAGQRVRITGDIEGNTITVSNVVMLGKGSH